MRFVSSFNLASNDELPRVYRDYWKIVVAPGEDDLLGSIVVSIVTTHTAANMCRVVVYVGLIVHSS